MIDPEKQIQQPLNYLPDSGEKLYFRMAGHVYDESWRILVINEKLQPKMCLKQIGCIWGALEWVSVWPKKLIICLFVR